MRFERVVQEVIEQSENWKVVESNRDIVLENGEIVTEIDIIAKSTKDTDNWITCEVKDFSFGKVGYMAMVEIIEKNIMRKQLENYLSKKSSLWKHIILKI